MKFETDHYKLVIRPVWVVKPTVKKQKCHICKGSGKISDPAGSGVGSKPILCDACLGSGQSEFYDAPKHPEIDKKFLDDLNDWFNNYEN